MGCACKWTCPDWPRSKYLPMSPKQSRSLSHFAPRSMRMALSSLFSHIVFIFSVPLPHPDSSLGILCYQVMLMAMKMWVDWQGWGGVREASKQPVLLLIKGEILQVAGCLRIFMARGKGSTRRAEWSFLGGGLADIVDFISGSARVMLLLMYCKGQKEKVSSRGWLSDWILDMGYFPCVDLRIHYLKCLPVAQMEIPVTLHHNSDVQN